MRVIGKSVNFLSRTQFAQVDHFLKDDVYKNLEGKFPKLVEFSSFGPIDKSNVIVKKDYYQFGPQDGEWKKFGSYFVSEEFFQKMCEFYEKDIANHYPKLNKKIKNKTLKIGIHGEDSFETCDILLDFQIGINTPVLELSTCRGPHLDNRKVLYVGLCYFKDEKDSTSSGHYTAYEVLNKKVRLGSSRSVTEDQIRPFTEVKYGANRLATFMNTPYSVHGVSQREITNMERKFFVFNAVTKEDLYFIKRPLWERILNKVLRK